VVELSYGLIFSADRGTTARSDAKMTVVLLLTLTRPRGFADRRSRLLPLASTPIFSVANGSGKESADKIKSRTASVRPIQYGGQPETRRAQNTNKMKR